MLWYIHSPSRDLARASASPPHAPTEPNSARRASTSSTTSPLRFRREPRGLRFIACIVAELTTRSASGSAALLLPPTNPPPPPPAPRKERPPLVFRGTPPSPFDVSVFAIAAAPKMLRSAAPGAARSVDVAPPPNILWLLPTPPPPPPKALLLPNVLLLTIPPPVPPIGMSPAMPLLGAEVIACGGPDAKAYFPAFVPPPPPTTGRCCPPVLVAAVARTPEP